jgi:hypothetical protein
MNQSVDRVRSYLTKKFAPGDLCATTLGNQCLPERVVAPNEELIAYAKTLDVSVLGNRIKLTPRTTIASSTREDQVPNAVQVEAHTSSLKRVREHVVDVCEVDRTFDDRYIGKTVKALALLVAIESTPARSHSSAARLVAGNHEILRGRLVLNCNEIARDFELPRGLDESPSRLNLTRKILRLVRGRETMKVVCESNAGRTASSLVDEETPRDLSSANNVKRIDDVIESAPHGDFTQLVRTDFTDVELAARVQKSTAARGRLFIGVLEVSDKVTRERNGQVLERNEIALGSGKL